MDCVKALLCSRREPSVELHRRQGRQNTPPRAVWHQWPRLACLVYNIVSVSGNLEREGVLIERQGVEVNVAAVNRDLYDVVACTQNQIRPKHCLPLIGLIPLGSWVGRYPSRRHYLIPVHAYMERSP